MLWDRKSNKDRQKMRKSNPLISDHVNMRSVGLWRDVWKRDKID